MNLRAKTFFIITAIFLAAFIFMALLLRSLIMSGYSQEETQLTRNRVIQARAAMEDALNMMANLTLEQANQDEAYQFMQDRNSRFIESRITDTIFLSRQLNLLAYLDTSGEIAYARAYDLNNKQEIPIPDDLKTYLSPGSPLLDTESHNPAVKGILTLPESIMMVVSHPILTDLGTGPARGTLVAGRYLDPDQPGLLPGVSNLKMTGYRVNDAALPEDFQAAMQKISASTSTHVQILDEDNIAGYTLFYDIHGQPAYILRIESNRVLYTHAVNDVSYFSISLFAFGLFFIMVILVILEKLVISRITKLSNRVTFIGQKGNLSARVSLPGKDEISGLASNINEMLDNIEESKRLQKESETFNYALLQDSPNPIEVMNADGSIRYVNPALEKITGYSQLQLIGRKPPFPWWKNENTQQFLNELEEAKDKGIQKIEKHYQKPNGESFWVEKTATVIKQDGKVQFYIANWVDITERKKAEKALMESEKRFREMAELLPELVFETDLKARLVFVNRVVFSVFGYLPEDSNRLSLVDLIAPEEKTTAERIIHKVIHGEELENTEFLAIRKDRTTFPAFIHATPITSNLGEVTGLRGIVVDITRQKQIEAELRESE